MDEFPFTRRLPFVAQVAARVADDPFASDHPPGVAALCRLLNATFLASMQSEEGHPVRASLALLKPEYSASTGIFRLYHEISLSPHNIAKLSASFPFRRGALTVRFSPAGQPVIWGVVVPKPESDWLL